MIGRAYEPRRDREAVHRIWREGGWIDTDEHAKALDVFLEQGRNLVADQAGAPECMVNTAPGSLRHLEEEVRLACVTGVTTSRVARKRGLATRLLAEALAQDTLAGAEAAMLGVFEQGFYNKVGFGNGPYERWCTFDPAQLEVDVTPRPPRRLGPDDWALIHANRLARWRTHGACTLLSPVATRVEMMWSENGFGLGYVDDAGALTHHFWAQTKAVEGGPYRILWMAYQTRDQFLELLGLLRGLGDQVRSVRLHEPGDIQLQDLLRQPFKMRELTRRSPHEQRMSSSAYWQLRILDLAGCLARTHLPGAPLSFNLDLSDPIEAFLPEDAPWRGVGGAYVVTLGPESSVRSGSDPSLPTLSTSIGAFTRMWLGARSPSGLSWTDRLEGPDELIRSLDRLLRLPAPASDWDF